MGSPPLELPIRIEDVTTDWLTSAIGANFPGVEVVRAHTTEVLWGTATKLKIDVDYNAQGRAAGLPTSLVVKGGFAEHRELMESCYVLEVRFYRDLKPQLALNTPRALFAGDDAGRRQHIVVMEDIGRRNVEFCRVQDPLDYRRAAAHLDVIARYQARWWDSSEFKPGGSLDYLDIWEPLPEGPAGAYHWGQLKPDNWERYIRLPRGAAIPKRMHDRERMREALIRLTRFGRQEPFCFLHGDYHLGNLYFDADCTPGTLDWQSYRKGHWSHDVTYFMISALDIEDRRRWDRALLSHYLNRLAAHGVSAVPDFDTAYDAFRRQILDGLYFWLVNPVEFQAEENNCAVTPRFAMAALDHGTFDVLLG